MLRKKLLPVLMAFAISLSASALPILAALWLLYQG